MKRLGGALFNSFTPVSGFKVSGVHCGLKKNNILDMAMFVSESPCTVAGLFTTNAFAAPPVKYDKALLAKQAAVRGVVINTRIANACTGEEGMQNARRFAEMAEEHLGFPADSMFCMSTGVIGDQLPLDKLERGVKKLSASLGTSPDEWEKAASGMLTTDTRPKHVFVQKNGFAISGCIKGAGMINPNIATMLSVITTDVTISQPLLQEALTDVAATSFNACTIDGDTSTNDTVLALANGASKTEITSKESEKYVEFREGLRELCEVMVEEMVRDGEGVTKVVKVRVVNAETPGAAAQVGKTIAHSLLVKTALFGSDSNWGRIMAAVGRSGVDVNPANCSLHVGDICVFLNGCPVPSVSQRALGEIMKQPDITLTVAIGTGSSSSQIVTCDLSLDYVSINADYRS